MVYKMEWTTKPHGEYESVDGRYLIIRMGVNGYLLYPPDEMDDEEEFYEPDFDAGDYGGAIPFDTLKDAKDYVERWCEV